MLRAEIILDETARFHARPAALIAEAAQKFESMICIEGEGVFADCKKFLSVMKIRVPSTGILEIVTEGSDERDAMSEIEYIIKNMYWR
ncbi:MAG: HPr family phosphocarrier protein [Lachnospiraceae bacterium]|nr:HPr family phosphocarrier protein [Lachnospiraceae bacterium]